MATQAVRAPRLPQSGNVRKLSIADIVGRSESLPNRYGLHAREGWGKTSFAAQAPRPIFIQTRGETGLDTLISNGQLPEIPHFPEIDTWENFRGVIQTLATENHPYRTLVVDTINGAERLCYEYICQRDFSGEWGDRGFGGYQRGYEVSLAEWRLLLNDLDTLRRARKMTIFLLVHTKVKTWKNPEGPDFDRWAPEMHEKCWGLTHKWLDCVLFGNFETIVRTASKQDDPMKKGKAADSIRMMYTQQRPAFDAKNRMGLAEEIEMGSSPAEAWANFSEALKAGKTAAETPKENVHA